MPDRIRRKASTIIMDEDPFGHVGIPMAACAMKVLIDLGDEFGFLHGVGGIALEDGLGTDAAAVAFQIAKGAVGAHFFEIGPESVTRKTNEPVLERRAVMGVEGQPKAIDIDRVLQFIPGAAWPPGLALAHAPSVRCHPDDECAWPAASAVSP